MPLVHSQGEGGVKQHSAHPAHSLLVIAGAPDTGGAVHGGGVEAALGRPLEPDVAVLAPVGPPGVTDQPVREGSAEKKLDNIEKSLYTNDLQRPKVGSISNQLNTVVD